MSAVELQHISVKVYAMGSAPACSEAIEVFHRWIQQKALPGLWIDVADYTHVPAGPGVLLIGHEAYFRYEPGKEERIGLVFEVREQRSGDNVQRLSHAIEGAMRGAALFSSEEGLRDRLHFNAADLRITIGDRLLCPNHSQSYDAIVPLIEQVLAAMPGAGKLQFALESPDPRERLSLSVKGDQVVAPADVALAAAGG